MLPNGIETVHGDNVSVRVAFEAMTADGREEEFRVNLMHGEPIEDDCIQQHTKNIANAVLRTLEPPTANEKDLDAEGVDDDEWDQEYDDSLELVDIEDRLLNTIAAIEAISKLDQAAAGYDDVKLSAKEALNLNIFVQYHLNVGGLAILLEGLENVVRPSAVPTNNS